MKHISVCISGLFDSDKFKKYGDLEQRSKIYEVQAVVYKVLIDLKTSEKDSLLLCEYLKKIIEAKKGRSATLLLHEAYSIIYQMVFSLSNDSDLSEGIANRYVEVLRHENIEIVVGIYLNKKYLLNKRG